MADNILSDFGINLLEEEIDDVIFQTNEFLCDATFTGSQGPFWWLFKTALCSCGFTSDYHPLTSLSRDTGMRRGTKTEQKRWKIKSGTSVLNVLTRTAIFVKAKIVICPESTKHFNPYILTFNCFYSIWAIQSHFPKSTVKLELKTTLHFLRKSSSGVPETSADFMILKNRIK